MKCLPVDVIVRKVEDRCFDELPVNYTGRPFYMAPRTHILQPYGAEIFCSSIFPGGFIFGSEWISFNPYRQHLPNPSDMRISNQQEWEYKEADGLMTKGLYSMDELESLKLDILYNSIRTAISSNFIT